MGLLRYLRGDDLLDEQRTLTPPQERSTWLQPYDPPAVGTVWGGKRINTSNVLGVADAFACIRVLADSISTLPLKVYRRTERGRVPAGDDSRAMQLLSRPSPGSTTVDLVSQIVTHLNVHGNAFVGKFRADGEIVQLGLLGPNRV